jgi:hypothetical protein
MMTPAFVAAKLLMTVGEFEALLPANSAPH